MEKNSFNRQVKRSDFIRDYLLIFNGFMGLTKKEIDVLELAIKDMSPVGILFADKDIRYNIGQQLGIKRHNLNNIIKSLKDKHATKFDKENGYTLNPRLKFDHMKTATEIEITFRVIVKDEDS